MAIKSILLGLLGAVKNFFITVGPLKIVFGALSLIGGTITAIKLIKKLIKKVKEHKANKAPATTMEMALAPEEVRAENPEAHAEYQKSVAQTAIKAFDLKGRKPKKGTKKRRHNAELDKLVKEINKYNQPDVLDVDSYMPISVYAERNPAFKKALMAR